MSNPKKKRKISKQNLITIIVASFSIIFLLCLVAGISVIIILLMDKPDLNLADFEQTESSTIYDQKGEEIANLGTVIRQNASYDELPNCLVDAFVAIEDSRFFTHNGFDIPRFSKAILENLRTFSFGQGGSTFTMQLIKNTYYTNDDTGEEASRSGMSGVRRKVQEIALALELERYEPKQFIFESYLNKLNYGADRNIRGIQKASQYYFSKDVTDLNLPEAALLAGVVNAPYTYNPFVQDSDGTYHLQNAQERMIEVLYQMYNHGYINKTEYELAKSVKIEDLLQDPYKSSTSKDGISYQAYVDAVVNETIELTGLDPYTTTMNIYTYMNKDIQKVMDEIQAQTKDDYLAFPDDYVECASVCVNNATGEVVGILGGRNYAGGGQLLLNHATEQYKQPGSSIKPILDYALAFENLGWATDHVLTDKPMYMDSSKQNLVYNYSGTYVGDVTLKQAVGNSINTCAIQTLQQVIDKMKNEYVVNYAQSLGYNFTLDDFNVQYGMGGSTCEVTPLEHAGAYAAIMNYGNYHTPHTISRIEFTNGKSPITPVYESKQVISEAAAYLTTDLMYSNVEYYGGSYNVVKSDDYAVYGKTGTTDWGKDGKEFGIPSGANKDTWLIASTSEYTTATWVGYEKAVVGQPSYVTNEYYNTRPQAKIAHLILDACYKYGDNKPSKIAKPSGVSSITHIIGTWPYASAKIDGIELDPKLITTGQIKTDSIRLVSLSAPTISEDPTGSGYELVGQDSEDCVVNLTWKQCSNINDQDDAGDVRDISLRSGNGDVIVAASGKTLFDYSWIYGPLKYKADITVERNGDVKNYSASSSSHTASVSIGDLRDGGKVKVQMYYEYENTSITSNKVDCNETDIGVTNRTIPGINTSALESIREWCNNYAQTFEVEKTTDPNDEKFVVYTNSDKTLVYDHSSTTQIPASTKLYAKYNVYMDADISEDDHTITITPIKGSALQNYSIDWSYMFPETWSISRDGDNLIIEYPDDSSPSGKNIVLKFIYGSDVIEYEIRL